MRTVHAPLVAMVPQRHPADCGAATLAMSLGISYEDALLALGDTSAGILRTGVWLKDLVRAAARFGVTFRKKPRWDPEHDEGIAQIVFREGPRHVVLLRAGLIFDTNFEVWEPDDYKKAKRARFGPLLVRVDE